MQKQWKVPIDRDDADVICYQIAGNVYKALEEVKECDKMYKKALKNLKAGRYTVNMVSCSGRSKISLPLNNGKKVLNPTRAMVATIIMLLYIISIRKTKCGA